MNTKRRLGSGQNGGRSLSTRSIAADRNNVHYRFEQVNGAISLTLVRRSRSENLHSARVFSDDDEGNFLEKNLNDLRNNDYETSEFQPIAVVKKPVRHVSYCRGLLLNKLQINIVSDVALTWRPAVQMFSVQIYTRRWFCIVR
jgi:hypothetical protein